MAGRKFIERSPDIIERVTEESLKIVGIEDVDDLIADLSQAIENSAK